MQRKVVLAYEFGLIAISIIFQPNLYLLTKSVQNQ